MNKISELRQRINDYSGTFLTVDDFNQLQSEWIIRSPMEPKEICGQALSVYVDVAMERINQDTKWGEQNHHPMEWLAILGEEVGEANKGALEAHFAGYEKTGSLASYREELIQVAAVAVAMVESLDRGKWNSVRQSA